MKLFIGFCALTLFNSAYGVRFRADYQYHRETGWFKYHHVPATWHEAWLKCFREGTVLASPENAFLLAAMRNFSKLADACAVYTGIHATFSKGDYYTVEGTPLWKIPSSWAPGEPDNAENSEDCLIMLSNGTLADVACTEVYPYFCYKGKSAAHTFFAGCGTVDNDYRFDGRTGSCYKFHRLPQIWPRAFAACAGEGGHLAIINSDAEAQVIKELYAKSPDSTMPGNFVKHSAHIGFCDWGERGLWLTVHGQKLETAGYNTWSANEPANSTQNHIGQYCGAALRAGTLNDVWCNLPTPFICEKAPDSLIDED